MGNSVDFEAWMKKYRKLDLACTNKVYSDLRRLGHLQQDKLPVEILYEYLLEEVERSNQTNRQIFEDLTKGLVRLHKRVQSLRLAVGILSITLILAGLGRLLS